MKNTVVFALCFSVEGDAACMAIKPLSSALSRGLKNPTFSTSISSTKREGRFYWKLDSKLLRLLFSWF
jgi:hypothetical protein